MRAFKQVFREGMGLARKVIGLRTPSSSILVRTSGNLLLPAAGEDMAVIEPPPDHGMENVTELTRSSLAVVPPARRKGPHRALTPNPAMSDPLLTVDDVGRRLNVSRDWVWDHCSRKKPKLPFIRMGDGALRFRASAIEAFIDERERLSAMHTRGRRKA